MNPERFGSFRVIGEMGPGRFGPVFCAQDASSSQVVVIRTFTPPLQEAERGALLEALTDLCAAPLDHASIAKPMTAGLAETPYLAHSYLPGKALDEVWQRIGPQPLADVIARLTRVAAALDFAAAAGVHHGLLAPCDIIFDAEDAGITGMGLAQALAPTRVSLSLPRSYASPQRLAGEPPALVDDVYAFAGIVFHLLVGEAPRPDALSRQVTNVQWALPEELLAAIEPALSSEPERRPESALAFMGRLHQVVTFASERAADIADIEATPEPPEPVIARPSPVVHASGDDDLLLNDQTDPPRWELDESSSSVFTIVPAEEPQPGTLAPVATSPRLHGHSLSVTSARKSSMTLPLVLGGAAALALFGVFGLGYQMGNRQTSSPRTSGRVAAATQDRAPAAVAEATTGQNPPGPTAGSAPSPDVASERPAFVAQGQPSSQESGAASVRAADAAPSAGLLIHSTPVGARVTVDDQARGTTPLVLRGLALGEHSVALALPGYQPQQRQVSLTAARPAQSLEFELRSTSAAANPAARGGDGSLQVDSRPVTAQVYLDDVLVGSTPLLLPNITAGSHTIRLELAGYQPWTTSVAVGSGTRTRVAASLDR